MSFSPGTLLLAYSVGRPAAMADQNVVGDLNKRQVELEEGKLEVEREKLFLERTKARWAATSAIVPAVVAFGTIIYGVWSLRETAKTQFETKLVEIAMQGPGPEEAISRAALVGRVFGEYLPTDFESRLAKIDTASLGNSGDPTVPAKKELLKLLADHPANRQAIIASWRALFPGDVWVSSLMSEHPTGSATSDNRTGCDPGDLKGKDARSCVSIFSSPKKQ
jgi:hypothetical protein